METVRIFRTGSIYDIVDTYMSIDVQVYIVYYSLIFNKYHNVILISITNF